MWNKPGDRVLEDILGEDRRSNELLIKFIRVAEETNYFIFRLLSEFHPGVPHRLIITRIDGDPMKSKADKATAPLSGNINPGQSGIVLNAAFDPAGSVTPPTFTTSWDSSDTSVAVTPDPSDTTGLTADVTVANTEAVGTTGTITANATGTNADGSPLSVSGQWAWTIVAVSEENPTGLVITRTA
jgi:hypothetical protein